MMKKTALTLLAAVALTAGANAQTLQLAYNFNDGQASAAVANATTFAPTAGAQLMTATAPATATPALTSNFTASNLVVFAGTTVNAVGTDVAGNALALQGGTGAVAAGTGGNNGDYLEFTLTSTNLTNLALSFAAQRTASGFSTITLAYGTSGDAGTFTTFGTAGTGGTAIGTSFATTGALSFALPTAAEKQTALTVRLTFTGGTSSTGNVRLDNIQFNSGVVAAPEPSTYVCLLGGLGGLALLRFRRHRTV